eukprot:TRINITY_DN3358_c0_g1_i4.p1 TRINITY_DN3358_c0_g1~~TRINITY_DN3358_c0_g1_i4.p1  ORF type:complete len:271 (+),score=44.42 TRINITY_DN3358_c0_g1_i4:88-900(+)
MTNGVRCLKLQKATISMSHTHLFPRLAMGMAKLAKDDVPAEDKALMSKIHLCLTVRIKAIKDSSFRAPMSFDQFKKVRAAFDDLFTGKKVAFPIDTTGFEVATEAPAQSAFQPDQGGSLLPPPNPFMAGERALTIVLEKIGLKDAQSNYQDPFITISVMDGKQCIGRAQDTPTLPPQRRQPSYVLINHNVYIQTPLERLPPDCAIFFEFKHYKPRQKKISTRCWSFLEMDEIKPGPLALEVYRKPTDLQKRRLSLLSVKPLYLHLNLSIR